MKRKRLLKPQEEVVHELLGRLYEQGNDAEFCARVSKSREGPFETHPYDDRPRYNTYTIAGVRGAGKSTVLHVVRQELPHLGCPPRKASEFATSEFEAEPQRIYEPHRTPEDRARAMPDGMRTALVLPIIDPSQFENERHTVMEQVIAHLSRVVENQIEALSSSGRRDRMEARRDRSRAWYERDASLSEGSSDVLDRLKVLFGRLQGEISRGWVFAQEFGQRMLQDDSASFDEFVTSRADRSVDAALRHRHWREVVDEVLDCFSTRLLIVSFDDCDLAPQHTLDVLDTVRIYLSSPRIAVILATDIDELRHNLRKSRLVALRDASLVLARGAPAEEATAELRTLVEREYLQADLFLDKVVPVGNRLHIHTVHPPDDDAMFNVPSVLKGSLPKNEATPEYKAKLTAEELAALERDKEILEADYRHIFSFLTPREAEYVKRLALQNKRSPSVRDLIAVSSPGAETNIAFSSILTVRRPLNVYLNHANEGFLDIAVRETEMTPDAMGPEDLVAVGPAQELWSLGPVDYSEITEELRFDRGAVFRGTLLAFLLDRRRRDKAFRALPVTIDFPGLDRRLMPPPLAEDRKRVSTDAEALLSDLSSYTDFPRNCRSLADAAKLLSGRLRRATPLDELDRFFAGFVDNLGRTVPGTTPGKLPLLVLVGKAMAQDRFKQDVVFRFLGVGAAISKGSTRGLQGPATAKALIHERLNDDLRAVVGGLEKLATELGRALGESRTAVFQLIDAAFIFFGSIGVKRSLPEENEIEALLSFGFPNHRSILTKLFDDALKAASADTGTAMAEAAYDLVIAAIGPLWVLRHHFGVEQTEALFAGVRTLWGHSMPLEKAAARILLPEKKKKNPTPSTRNAVVKVGGDTAERETWEAEEWEGWDDFVRSVSRLRDGDPNALQVMAKFLAVPTAVLEIVLEPL